MGGFAYLRAGPDDTPFVEAGSAVKPGDRLLLIEAMGTFSDVVAPRSGVVIRVLVDDGAPVEFGQPLIVLG